MAKSKFISNMAIATKTPTTPAIFKAALTDKGACAVENAVESWGVTRRIAYALLTRSSQQLVKGLREGGDELAEGMMDTLNTLRVRTASNCL